MVSMHLFPQYSTLEEAVLTRNSLHGVKWPQSNPKFLSADFAEQDEVRAPKGQWGSLQAVGPGEQDFWGLAQKALCQGEDAGN